MKFRVDVVQRREGSRDSGKGVNEKCDALEVGVSPVPGGGEVGIAGKLHFTVPTGAASPVEEGKSYSLDLKELKASAAAPTTTAPTTSK